MAGEETLPGECCDRGGGGWSQCLAELFGRGGCRYDCSWFVGGGVVGVEWWFGTDAS